MANISGLVATQLSKAAYGKSPPPTGWTLQKTVTSADGQDSFSVFTNGKVAVMAFKGSDNPTNFKNDLVNSGYGDWQSIKKLANDEFDKLGFLRLI